MGKKSQEGIWTEKSLRSSEEKVCFDSFGFQTKLVLIKRAGVYPIRCHFLQKKD